MGLNANIRHVPGQYATIQQAVNAANPGDTILVAEGTYYENFDLSGLHPLLVGSEFIMDGNPGHIAKTIIDGSFLTGTNRSLVYFGAENDTTTVLSGFTLQNGRGTTRDAPHTQIIGGAIVVVGGGAKITHNVIRNNLVTDSLSTVSRGLLGGGIFVEFDDPDYWAVITDNTITGNRVRAATFRAIGGGICSFNNVRIANNTITGNSCVSIDPAAMDIGGGGIYAQSSTSPKTMLLTNNIIENNSITGANATGISGGGVTCSGISNDLTVIATGNRIRSNQANLPGYEGNIYGAGMALWSLQAGSRIENNRFEWNECELLNLNPGISYGGGLFAGGSSDSDTTRVILSGNRFLHNSADFGGGLGSSGLTLQVENNLFNRNLAMMGGGGYIEIAPAFGNQNHTFFVNNTFFRNSTLPEGQAGALQFVGANPVVLNSIFYRDSASVNIFGNEIYMQGGTLELVNCNLDTIPSGYSINLDNGSMIKQGIMYADPLFADTIDLHPMVWSSCVDAGLGEYASVSGSTVYAPAYDILGTPRPAGAGYDVGAYDDISGGVGIRPLAGNRLHVTNYPNPFSGLTTFDVTLDHAENIDLEVFNSAGKLVATPFSGNLAQGKHELQWDASGLPAGIYFYEAVSGKETSSGKLVVDR